MKLCEFFFFEGGEGERSRRWDKAEKGEILQRGAREGREVIVPFDLDPGQNIGAV